LAPKRYYPLVFEPDFEEFEKFALHQAICDLIFAFQENHKLAASNLKNVFGVEKNDEIIEGVFTYLLNDKNSPKPVIFFS
jgi:hypothetical protein